MQLLFKGITTPAGFKATGVSAGIKKDNKLDIALLYSEKPCTCAGVFTTNVVKGHSLVLAREYIKKGRCQVIFINSGNANACVGNEGYSDAVKITELVADKLGIPSFSVITGSTGVIGFRLPMDKIESGITEACQHLSSDGGDLAAKAIMTTDTFPKELSVKIMINDKEVIVSGMAKGSGMIQPNMATMISVLTTDAVISSSLLKKTLKYAVNKTFNKISVDGDTSVCDKTVILANGMSECKPIKEDSIEYEQFKEALLVVCTELSKMIARDGEGATKLIEVNVINGRTQKDVSLACKAIANSPLVKTAFFGEDANWGRLLTAAGYSGANFDPSMTTISLGDLVLFNKGTALKFNEDIAKEILSKKDIVVTVDFGDGSFNDTVWTCDFSFDYIKINAHYRS
ncbi:MAG: bifunctional glutamate N-acetyltransferase/amino-acid acetyltransferase ArgJ [Clostridia bacterium]|nr:bifunctional glutamate N-acetyltransferase/amino-acid acetyltransferase ArgJ [Clostridia bacterium]